MAADVQTGMDKQDMKRLLMRSKKEPVNCAIGLGADPGYGLLMMDKVKAPKGVEKELLKQIPEAKNTRFGTVFVDLEVDPKLVLFTLNKPVSSIAKKLVKTLKGTGFNKVKIAFEDGSPGDDASEEEDGALPPPAPGEPQAVPSQAGTQPAQTTAVPPAAPPVQGAAPQPPPVAAAQQPPAAPAAPPPQAAPAPAPTTAAAPPANLGALPGLLADLVKRLAQADASLQGQLKGLAVDAQAMLKANDVPGATAAIERLRSALDVAASAAPPATAPASASAPGAAKPPAAPAVTAAYAKARVAWIATRQKLETDISKLQTTFASAFKDHDMAADLQAAFQTRVEKVLGQLDAELADKLDAVTHATDPGQHAQRVAEARKVMQRYQAFVESDPTLTELDTNPFVPMAIQKTIATTLSVLDKTLG